MKDVKMLGLGMVVGLSFFASFMRYLALIPLAIYLLEMLNCKSLKEGISKQFKFSFGYHLIGISWVISGYSNLTFLNKSEAFVFTSVGYLVMCFLLSLLYLLVPLIMYGFKWRQQHRIMMLIGSYAFVEYLWELGPLSFPWLRLGLLNEGVFGLYLASIGGVYLNTIFMLLMAYLIGNKNYRKLGVVLVLCFTIRTPVINNGNYDVTLIQPNMSTLSKWDEERNDDYLISLIEESENDVYLSETMIVYEDTLLEDYLEHSSKNIYYGYLRDKQNKLKYNHGEEEYAKQKLVLIGEYVPDWLSTMIPLFNEVNLGNQLKPGDKAVLLNGKIGALICFDDLYPSVSVNSVRAGAEVLYIPSNDAWFNEIEYHEHLLHALMRSAECGRSVIRVGNTGYTFTTNHLGQITSMAPCDELVVLNSKVELRKTKTIYVLGGCYLPVVLGLLLLVNLKGIKKEEFILLLNRR